MKVKKVIFFLVFLFVQNSSDAAWPLKENGSSYPNWGSDIGIVIEIIISPSILSAPKHGRQHTGVDLYEGQPSNTHVFLFSEGQMGYDDIFTDFGKGYDVFVVNGNLIEGYAHIELSTAFLDIFNTYNIPRERVFFKTPG